MSNPLRKKAMSKETQRKAEYRILDNLMDQTFSINTDRIADELKKKIEQQAKLIEINNKLIESMTNQLEEITERRDLNIKISDELEEKLGKEAYAEKFFTPKEREHLARLKKVEELEKEKDSYMPTPSGKSLEDRKREIKELRKGRVRRSYSRVGRKSEYWEFYRELKYKERIMLMNSERAEIILSSSDFSSDFKKFIMFNLDVLSDNDIYKKYKLNFKLWVHNIEIGTYKDE